MSQRKHRIVKLAEKFQNSVNDFDIHFENEIFLKKLHRKCLPCHFKDFELVDGITIRAFLRLCMSLSTPIDMSAYVQVSLCR